MKGIVVTTNNKATVREFTSPLFESVGDAVGGFIEVVHPRGLPQPYCMVVNEEGLLRGLPHNAHGSLLYGTPEHGHPIVGDIVFMKEGWTADGPDIVGLCDDDVESIITLLTKQYTLTVEEGKNNETE